MLCLKVVLSKSLSWLVQRVLSWEFLTEKEFWERIHTVVLVMDIDNVNGIISQIVMDNKLLPAFCIKLQHFSIILQELLLRF